MVACLLGHHHLIDDMSGRGSVVLVQVLGRQSAADVCLGDKVAVGQFVQAWQLLGLQVTTALAVAVFNKYGQDVNGRMPVMVICCLKL